MRPLLFLAPTLLDFRRTPTTRCSWVGSSSGLASARQRQAPRLNLGLRKRSTLRHQDSSKFLMAMQDAIRISEQVESLVLDAQMDTARTAELLHRTAQQIAKSKDLIANAPAAVLARPHPTLDENPHPQRRILRKRSRRLKRP